MVHFGYGKHSISNFSSCTNRKKTVLTGLPRSGPRDLTGVSLVSCLTLINSFGTSAPTRVASN